MGQQPSIPTGAQLVAAMPSSVQGPLNSFMGAFCPNCSCPLTTDVPAVASMNSAAAGAIRPLISAVCPQLTCPACKTS